MGQSSPTTPIIIRAAQETVDGIDALAALMDRSRNYVVNQAIRQYLDTNAWQIERIREGIAAADEGRVVSGEEVFAAIERRHGW